MFIRIKIARKFKFYVKIIISGGKSVKKGQKNAEKKPQIALITRNSKTFFGKRVISPICGFFWHFFGPF